MNDKNLDHNSHVRLYHRIANSIARNYNHSKATKIYRYGYNGLVYSIKSGYRKYSDDTYVSNAYRCNFGWKNTYYQPAICFVSIA